MKNGNFKNIIFLLFLFASTLSSEAKTVVVNSLNPTGNYGALAGAHFDASGNFISNEMSLPVAIWLTSGANLCASPGDQRYKQYCGADTILFNIDPQYAGGQTKGPYVLTLQQGVQLYDKLFIDGFSQPGASKGNPMIYITGTDNDTWQISAHKTYGDASGTHIRGTGVINTKNHAFYVSSVHDVIIEDNYVGVNTDGSASTGLQKGIHIGDGANNIIVQNNVFSGANLNAIEMNPGTNQLTQTMGTPHDIHIIGNMIGIDITGTKGDPKYGNKGTGININGATGNIEIKGNIIGYNGTDPKANQSGTNGIDISNSTGISITNNFIGVGADGSTQMPNSKNGIALWHGTGGSNKDIVIENNNISFNNGNGVEISGGNNTNVKVGADYNGNGSGNIISYNTKDGIHLENYGSGGPNNIPFRKNSIYCNGGKGSTIASASNNAIVTPVIDLVNSTVSPVKIVGTAPANSKVDLYMVDPNCFNCAGGGTTNENQGKTYIGSVDADGAGKWTFPCGSGITGAVVAHATTSINNSSEFSNIFKINCTPPIGKLVTTLLQPATICEGSAALMSASHTIDKTTFPNPTANPTYVFYVDGVKVGQNSTGSFTPPSSVFKAPKAFLEVEVIYTKTETGLCFDLSDKDFKWLNINAKLAPPDAGANAQICSGTSYQLAGNAGLFSAVKWTSAGDGSFDDATKSNAIYTPGNNDKKNGSVKLTLTGSGSCNSAPDDMTLTLIAAPKVNLGNDTSICSGSLTYDAGNVGASYLWSTGAVTKSILVNSAGTFWVKVTNATGCFSYDTVKVKVGTPPVVDLGKDIKVCTGNTVILNAGVFSTYAWTPGNATTQKLTVDKSGDYILEATNANGCKNRDTINVFFYPLPVVKIVKDTMTCVNQIMTLDAGAGYASYLWSPSGAKTQKINVSVSGKYIITVSDVNGCSTKDSSNVTFTTLPQVSIGSLKTQLRFCEGKSTTLQASGTATDAINKNIPLQYLWSPGNSTGKNLVVNKSGDYVVTVTDGNGCKNTDTIAVIVDAPDTADFTLADYCDYSSSPSPVKAKGFTNGGSFSLVNPLVLGSTSINSSTGNISKGKGGTTYTVQYITKGFCPDTAQDLVTVNPTPVIQKNPDPISICGGNASFKITATGVAIYQWQEKKAAGIFSDVVDGGNYNGAKSAQLNLSNVTQIMDGYQYRCVVSAGICSDTSTAALLTVSSLTAVNDPSPQIICEGKNTSFTVVPTGVKSMEWEFSSDNGSTYNKVIADSIYKNISFPTLLINGATKNMDGYLFRAHVIGCLYDATSKGAALSVLTSPSISKHPEDKEVCYGGQTFFLVSSADADAYVWQVSTDGGKNYSDLKNAGAYDGVNSAELNIHGITMAMNGNIYRSVVKGNCDPVFSKSANLKVDTTIVSASADRLTICVDQSATLTAVATPANATYQWKGGGSSAVISVSPQLGSTTYSVIATVNGCNSEAAPITISVSPKPQVNAGEDQLVCPGSEIILGANEISDQTFSWISVEDDFKSAEANPSTRAQQKTVYVVNARNSACPDGVTDTVVISTIDAPTLFIPNAFTPNQDGVNDVFKIAGEGIIDFKGSIYNRWGELIFEWNDVGAGWDGIAKNHLVQEDVYVYKINVKNMCNGKKVSQPILGSVTVIR